MKEIINKIKENMDKALWIVLLIILAFAGTKKSGFHVDEFFSIINANWSVEEQKAEEAKQKNTYSGQELINLCLVQQADDRFDFETVWKNQASDTHPPLYYVLVHTAASIFMTRLNMIELGLLVNIPIALLIYFFMIKLIQLFTDNKKEATIYAFLYSISFCAVNSFLFVRMYLLLILFSILLIYILCKSCTKDSVPISFYVQLGLIEIGGTLTQYYFLIFLFSACLVMFIFFCMKKKYKILGLSCITTLVSLILAYMIFPASLTHMLKGNRGLEAIENAASANLVQRTRDMFSFINAQVYGNCGILVMVAILILLGLVIYKKRDKSDRSNIIGIKYYILILPGVLTFLVISKVAAYTVDRYIMEVMFCFFLGSFLLMRKLALCICNSWKTKVGILFVVAICILLAYRKPLPYLVSHEKGYIEQIEELGNDTKCFYMFDESSRWKIQSNLFELERLQDITFYTNTDYLYYCTDYSQYDTFILYDSMDDRFERISEIQQKVMETGNYTDCEYLFSSGYADAYVFTREKNLQ